MDASGLSVWRRGSSAARARTSRKYARGRTIRLAGFCCIGRFSKIRVSSQSALGDQRARAALASAREGEVAMLYVTELMGAKTYDSQGNYVGKVREFFIEPAEQPNRIARYLVSRAAAGPVPPD